MATKVEVFNPTQMQQVLRAADGSSVTLNPGLKTQVDEKYLWDVPRLVRVTK